MLLFMSLTPLVAHAFLSPDRAFEPKVLGSTSDEIYIRFDIPNGYYIYRDKIKAHSPSGDVATIAGLPRGQIIDDFTFGEAEILRNGLQFTIKSPDSGSVQLHWQGCAEAGLCYEPQSKIFPLSRASTITSQSIAQNITSPSIDTSNPVTNKQRALTERPITEESVSISQGNDAQIVTWLSSHSFLVALPVFFALGLALTFTPCVLPMIPILSSIVLGRGATGKKAFILSTAFVLPMALTYATLGALAALMGSQMQAVMQNIWFISALGLIFFFLALAMFGIYTLQLPESVRSRLDNLSRESKGGTLIGAMAMGVISALLVGPCMTAPLAGVLLYIAQTDSVVTGTALLFSMGLGMGLPLILIGTLGPKWLPKPGQWMDTVKALFGFGLLVTGIWMLDRVLHDILILALWGLLFVSMGLSLLVFARPFQQATRIMIRTLAYASAIWGVAMLVGALGGNSDPLRPLALSMLSSEVGQGEVGLEFTEVSDLLDLEEQMNNASMNGKAVMIDFTADWCTYCAEIERTLYTSQHIKDKTEGMVLLQVDVTRQDIKKRDIMRHFEVVGPPTVLFIDTNGNELRDSRLVGSFNERQLLDSLNAIY